MEKLSIAEKKQTVGGFARTYTKTAVKAQPIPKFKWNLSNTSLLALSSIPGLVTFGEGIYSLFSKKLTNNYSFVSRGRSYGSSYADSRRDFFAYASEAFRPALRFSPYPSKNGITFAMPWFV